MKTAYYDNAIVRQIDDLEVKIVFTKNGKHVSSLFVRRENENHKVYHVYKEEGLGTELGKLKYFATVPGGFIEYE